MRVRKTCVSIMRDCVHVPQYMRLFNDYFINTCILNPITRINLNTNNHTWKALDKVH